jgi:alpha-tubulin suppressor-like RCC1 family protein
MKWISTVAAVGACLCLAPAANAGTVSHWGSYLNGEEALQPTPLAVSGLSEVVSVDASNSSGYALAGNGTVWAWGNGQYGQLGDGSLGSSLTTPVQVKIPARIVSIGEAKNEGLAIDSTGQAWVWGENGSNSLCVRGKAIATPVKVGGLRDVVAGQGGEEHTLWLTPAGGVLSCGRNTWGELGLGEAVDEARTPTPVPGLSEIVQVSVGERTSAARDGKGRVFMWGDNVHGAIGVGSKAATIWTPGYVTLPGPASEVSTGGDLEDNGSSFAVLPGETLYGWGDDNHGQVGDDSTADKLSPVNTGLHFASVVAGGVFSLGLTKEGEVYSWGGGFGGSLGVGGRSGPAFTPIFVESGVSEISATAKNAEDLHGARR